jgi:hypothetical protein
MLLTSPLLFAITWWCFGSTFSSVAVSAFQTVLQPNHNVRSSSFVSFMAKEPRTSAKQPVADANEQEQEEETAEFEVNENALLEAFGDFQAFLKKAGSGLAEETSTSSRTLFSSTTTKTAAPSSTALTPHTIHDGVFTFNRVLVDTIYNLICFLYPTDGTERDFAKFYVLETVARVP